MIQLPKSKASYRVEGVPRGIKAKITQFGNAAVAYAFRGTQPPEYWLFIEEDYHTARNQLERLIAEHMKEKETQE